MVPATNPGSVYVKKDGVDYSVIKILTSVRTTNPVGMVGPVLILDKVVTLVAALRDSTALTVKYPWTIALRILVKMEELAYLKEITTYAPVH